jgi:hypothetical protein
VDKAGETLSPPHPAPHLSSAIPWIFKASHQRGTTRPLDVTFGVKHDLHVHLWGLTPYRVYMERLDMLDGMLDDVLPVEYAFHVRVVRLAG